MAQFLVPANFNGYLIYDLGYLRNPPNSMLLSNFTIQTLDIDGNVID